MTIDLKDLFPYEYVGGGYFREKGIAQGKQANVLHGMEAIQFVTEAIAKKMQDEPKKDLTCPTE